MLYLFCDAVYYVVQGGECVNQTLNCDHSNESLTEQYFRFLWCCLLYCTRLFYPLSLWMTSSSVTIQIEATEEY